MKPLGRKAYGSIGHLPNSRLGPGDHRVHAGQAAICCEKVRDKYDKIVVQEKLDGSCCAVYLAPDGQLHALGRSGYLAQTSGHEQHQLFAAWVRENEDRFRRVLKPGERMIGEWLAQAHGTIYYLNNHEPFAAFDIMIEGKRLPFGEFMDRVLWEFYLPSLLHEGGSITTESAMSLLEDNHWPCDEVEGVVYRVERKGEVDFLAKFVHHGKKDGKYFPEHNDGKITWNWKP